MTSEQRLDRLERIAKLFVTAGLRMRHDLRQLDDKIGILIDAQIQGEDQAAENRAQMRLMMAAQKKYDERFAKADERFAKADERFAKADERFAKYDERFAKYDERFAKADQRFAKLEKQADQTMKTLLELVKRGRRNGNS